MNIQNITVEENPLIKLVEKLESQQGIKRDIVSKAPAITYRNGKIWIQETRNDADKYPGLRGYTPTDICHSQIAEKLGIPAKYYHKMRIDYPELLEYNVNMWMAKDLQIKYLLRTFDGGKDQEQNIARALLSDQFNLLDNYDVLFTALKTIKEMNITGHKITKAEVTDKRLYLHIEFPEIQIQAEEILRDYMKNNDAVGNGIMAGLVITNSEIGLGSFEIRPRAVIVKCNNGLIAKDESFRRVHLGAKMDEGAVQWSEKTKKLNYELVMSQTSDAVKMFLSTKYLGKMVKKLHDASYVSLDYPIDTIQNICNELKISEDDKRGILKYFVGDGDSKASGVFQAITRQAGTMDPDGQYELETAAFDMLPKIKKFDKPFSKN